MDVREILDANHIEYKFSPKDYVVKCLSPEHNDSNPSCHVDKISGIFQCWSCGYSGDIYAYFNMHIPNQVNTKVDRLKNKIKSIIWSKPLEKPLDAVDHLWEYRGISAETLKHFDAFTTDSLGMEGRLIIPIKNMDGDSIVFQGRQMHSDIAPKYKIYPQHVEIPLFPEAPPKVNGSIILVEGIFDLLNLYDRGLKNVVQCGGVHIGLVKKRAKQQRNIERLLPYLYQGIQTLHILFDGDKAGRDAAEGLQKYAGDIFNIQIHYLDEGKDPGSLTQAEVNTLKETLYGKST